jgi:hypothetical protein
MPSFLLQRQVRSRSPWCLEEGRKREIAKEMTATLPCEVRLILVSGRDRNRIGGRIESSPGFVEEDLEARVKNAAAPV